MVVAHIKLAHVQRQTAGDGDGGDGGVALTLVAHDIFTIFSQYFYNIFTIFSQNFHDIFTISYNDISTILSIEC